MHAMSVSGEVSEDSAEDYEEDEDDHKGSWCPEGFEFWRGQCLKYTPIKERCPTGYEQHQKRCFKQTTYSAQAVCPPDTYPDLTIGRCRHVGDTHSASKSCPKGFEFSPNNYSLCERFVPKMPGSCAEGFSPSLKTPDVCEKVSKYPPMLACSGSGILEGGTCKTPVAAPPTCPKGFVPTRSNSPGEECVMRVTRAPVCPEGFEIVPTARKREFRCRRHTTVGLESFCEAGTLVDGGNSCLHIEARSADLKCAKGTVLEEGKCVSMHPVSQTFICPQGFQAVLNHDTNNARTTHFPPTAATPPRCVKVTTHSCPMHVMKEVCEPENSPLKGGKHFEGTQIPFGMELTMEGAAHGEGNLLNCRQLPEVMPRQCDKIEHVNAALGCPEGAHQVGDTCVLRDISELLPACHEGEKMDSTGRCFRATLLPITRRCPEGTEAITPSQGVGHEYRKCRRLEDHPADYVCPSGYRQEPRDGLGYWDCSMYSALHEGTTVFTTSAAEAICHWGGVMNEGRCVSVQQVPIADPTCPPNSSESADSRGDCVERVAAFVGDAGEDDDHHTVVPQFVCRDGKAVKGPKCQEEESVVPDLYCPEDTRPVLIPNRPTIKNDRYKTTCAEAVEPFKTDDAT